MRFCFSNQVSDWFTRSPLLGPLLLLQTSNWIALVLLEASNFYIFLIAHSNCQFQSDILQNDDATLHFCSQVRRVQNFVDTLDNLKARNSNPFSNGSNAVSVSTKWQTFESGVGSLSAPVPVQSGTKITQDWELFD